MSDDVLSKFGKTLNRVRREKRVTQEDLQFRTGMSQSFISNLENGNKEPCLKAIVQLADALEVSPAALVDGLGRVADLGQ